MSPSRRPPTRRIQNVITPSIPTKYKKLRLLFGLTAAVVAFLFILLTRSGDIEATPATQDGDIAVVAGQPPEEDAYSSAHPDEQIKAREGKVSPVMLTIRAEDLLSKPVRLAPPDEVENAAMSPPAASPPSAGEVQAPEKPRADLSPMFAPYTRAQFMLSSDELLPPANTPEFAGADTPELRAMLAPSPEESIRQDWRRILAGGRLANAPAGQSSLPSILAMFGPAPRTGRDAAGFLPFGETEKLDHQDAMSRVMFLVREADADMMKGALDDALNHYLEALNIYPQMSYANQQAGRLHLLLRRYREAIRFFEAALTASTELGEVLNDLGVAHLYAGQAEKALENFEAARQAEPEARDPLFNKGLVYQRLGRAEDARRQFETCIRVMPDDARAYRELAILDVAANDRDSALYRLQQAITVDPAWPQPLLDAALLHAESGNHERALGLLDVALEITPVRVVYRVYQQPAFRVARLGPGGKPFEERLARKAREQMRTERGDGGG